jgi:hypothetical protein
VNEPVLNQQDRDSAVWQNIRKHYEARLQSLRVSNDKPQDAEKTATLRGRIAEANAILSLDRPTPVFDEHDTHFKD